MVSSPTLSDSNILVNFPSFWNTAWWAISKQLWPRDARGELAICSRILDLQKLIQTPAEKLLESSFAVKYGTVAVLELLYKKL